jgi:hypothetical protein
MVQWTHINVNRTCDYVRQDWGQYNKPSAWYVTFEQGNLTSLVRVFVKEFADSLFVNHCRQGQ